MVIRPIVHNLRVGTDICKISRIQTALLKTSRLERNKSAHPFVHKVLTPQETLYYQARYGQDYIDESMVADKARFLAGR